MHAAPLPLVLGCRFVTCSDDGCAHSSQQPAPDRSHCVSNASRCFGDAGSTFRRAHRIVRSTSSSAGAQIRERLPVRPRRHLCFPSHAVAASSARPRARSLPTRSRPSPCGSRATPLRARPRMSRRPERRRSSTRFVAASAVVDVRVLRRSAREGKVLVSRSCRRDAGRTRPTVPR